MKRFVLVLVLVLALSSAGGCSPSVETPTYEYGIFPRVAYSGFNAKATYRVMFATSAPDPQWTVADPSLATIVPSPPPTVAGTDVKSLNFALVTTTKPGTSAVRMTSGSTVLTAQLVVKAYTDEQLVLGKARYETASTDPLRPPCASCHAKPGGVDHSPLKMAGFDDATILGVIQNATYPASPTGQSTTSAFVPAGPLTFKGHTWNLTDPEKDGILAHLRSLALGGL
jgi:hypothetical protein